jgi:hypothetical protein
MKSRHLGQNHFGAYNNHVIKRLLDAFLTKKHLQALAQ